VYDKSVIQVDSAKVNTIGVAMGKMSAKKLGLKLGDTLNDVLDLKEKFFINQLKPKTFRPANVDIDLYDTILYGNDGSRTLVVVGNLNNNSERISEFNDNDSYRLRGSNY
jgi:hypothetical protein